LTANLRLPMGLDPEMYTVQGEWHLPDGSVVEGTTLNYSPTAADAANRRAKFEYLAWIEGFKEQTLRTLIRTISVGQYSWPEFQVDLKASLDLAPVLVTLSAVPDAEFTGTLEKPTYSWTLPAGLTIYREIDHGRAIQVNFPKAGSHEVAVDVTDARGSTAHATGTVVLKNPDPFQVEFTPVYSNQLKRELLTLTLRTKVTGGHPQDRLVDYVFSINNPEVEVVQYGSSGIFKDMRQGSYVAHLKATSKLGQVVEADFPVQVIANLLPTCEIDSWETGDYLWYQAGCTDADGRVVSWRWYLDETLICSGKTIRRKTSELTGTLRFEAADDAGGIYSEVLSQ